MNKQPIGIFDSGVGGTSIWAEIVQLLPSEHTVYLADSKYAPYGDRSIEDIINLSIKNTEKLLTLGCKIIVVACNTATTNAIAMLRERYPVPFIGIEPAIKPAALATRTNKIGILATKGTLSSELFAKTSDRYKHHLELIEVVGTGLVPLIEKDQMTSPEMRILLQRHLQPMIAQNIDHLVLGCSHYPYLIPLLRELLPAHITIIDSGEAVAKQTKKLLELHNLTGKTKNPTYQFYTNATTTTLSKILNIHQLPHSTSYLDF